MSYSDLHEYKRIYSGKSSGETNFTHTHTFQDEKPIEKAENLEVRVRQFLKDNPGLTGIEIASKLCVHELIIYNVLIDKLKDVCYKDENNHWFLIRAGSINETTITQDDKTLPADFTSKIELLLTKNPGLKAKEIGEILNIDKSLVNSSLYGKNKSRFSQNNKFQWFLKNKSLSKEKISRQNVDKLIKKALENRLVISMEYKGFPRVIFPYCADNTYCVGYCTLKSDLRTFRIDRMKNVTLGQEFEFDYGLSSRSLNQINNVGNFRKHY